MFCPNCGARNSSEQKFCRSCGMNLEKSIESLAEQLPNAQSASLLKQSKMLEKFGSIAFGGLITLILIAVSAIIYAIFANMILPGKQFWAGILLVAFIIFAILSLVYVFLNESLKEKQKKINFRTSGKAFETKTEELLLPEHEFTPAASVTENTTELLYAESQKRRSE